MTTLTIRNVDAALKEPLRVRAARHGHSMEAELRQILEITLAEPEGAPEPNLAEPIRRLAPLGGPDLELPPDELVGSPPSFGPLSSLTAASSRSWCRSSTSGGAGLGSGATAGAPLHELHQSG